MNTNKFLAYTALGLSNTQLWKGFDISKAIVVDDIEYSIPNQKVRYIYTQTQEDKDMVEELQNNFKTYNDEIKLLKTYKDIMKTEGLSEYNSMSRKEINANIKNLQELKRDVKKQIKEISNKYHTCEIKEMSVDIPFTDGLGKNDAIRNHFTEEQLEYYAALQEYDADLISLQYMYDIEQRKEILTRKYKSM